jgi:hypothetical protein
MASWDTRLNFGFKKEQRVETGNLVQIGQMSVPTRSSVFNLKVVGNNCRICIRSSLLPPYGWQIQVGRRVNYNQTAQIKV